ncbi:superfamily I DNA and RNA helicases and helicase subunits [Bacteroides pyogenes JCM 10003]|nr:superfamily I DNA and RNA helicases and helicase subunits [Bacteroides pyogenes JCM 10003]
MGYTVHTDIGYSGYKIDIGIVDREHPQKYRVGIICDGKNYRQTKTVRDREIVQNGVLKGLGWNICRIWTMDWWEKPDEVIASIQRAMENGHAADDMPPARNEEKKSVSPPRIAGKEISGSANSQSRHEENGREEYTEAKLTPGKYPSDKLAAPRSASILASQVRKIIACEAPISKTLLSKKVLSEWGINRIVQRAEFPLAIAFDESNLYRTFHGELVIFWKSEEQYRTYSAYRPDSGRDAADLPPEEVANAIRQLVKDSISLPLPDLIKGGARLFGFTRMGTNIEAAIRRGIQEASARGFINIENDRVMMPEA